ncbi:MAG: hypothetical protein ACHP9Y_04905 [Gammaproteobacteria bacterium]
MTMPMENNRLKLNKYSWSILIAFICATIAMLYGTANNSLQDFFQALPLIVISIYYCEKLAPLLDQPEHNLKKSKLFIRDSFILTFGFLLASLISLIFAYNNSDAKAWWSLIIYLYTLYGLFFFSSDSQSQLF